MKFLSATSSCCSVYYALLYRRESFSRKYTTRKILTNYISDGISDSLLPLQSHAIGDTWPGEGTWVRSSGLSEWPVRLYSACPLARLSIIFVYIIKGTLHGGLKI